MTNVKQSAAVVLLLLALYPVVVFAQKQKPIPVCRQATFAAVKPLPKLEYACPEGLSDYDDKILKLPGRTAALAVLVKEFESFSDPAWWRADVDELSACGMHGKPGTLTADEQEKFKDNDYDFLLLGNHEFRLVLVSDPCYQTGYNGSIAFLLYHKGAAVFATLLLNGYYSRIDNSVGIAFANLNGQTIIEISTANNMPPQETNYYFVIDPRTNKAVPKKLFKIGGKLTNEITSAMIIGEPSDLGLPKNSVEMEIVRHNRLAPTFSAYREDFNGEGDGHKLLRTFYRWNGRYYAVRR
jgi:hypothetical protein